jgi:hypothetical protein
MGSRWKPRKICGATAAQRQNLLMVRNQPFVPDEIDACRFLIVISGRLMNTYSAVALLLRAVERRTR